jgi:hypothetical protein
MNLETSEPKSSPWFALAAFFVLYVLSVPWIITLAYNRAPESLIGACATPYAMLMKVPGLGSPLHDYLTWCGKLTRRGPFFVPSE